MKTQTITKADRIKALLATEPALVGSDEGTHGTPRSYRIYETIRGKRYAMKSFADNNPTLCTEEEANRDSGGRMRHFPTAQAEIRAKQVELRKLEKAI